MRWEDRPISDKQRAFILSRIESLQGLGRGMLFYAMAPKLYTALDTLTQGEASKLISALIQRKAETNSPLSDEELDNIRELIK